MNSAMNSLKTALLDLLRALKPHGIPVILCGGLGLYLKQLDLQSRDGYESLINGEHWPVPRTTHDMDIMVQTDVLASATDCETLREVLSELGYEVIRTRQHFQFVKPLDEFRDVKIDLLTGAIAEERIEREFVIDRNSRIPRARPRGASVGLHAWWTEEAIGFDQDCLELPISGPYSDGGEYAGEVLIPQPLTLLMMKLHAFRDRYTDTDKDLARHHAMDLYRIMAMMGREEYFGTQEKIRDRKSSGCVVVQEATQIVNSLFVAEPRWGWIRIREHADFKPDMPVEEVVSALVELFGL